MAPEIGGQKSHPDFVPNRQRIFDVRRDVIQPGTGFQMQAGHQLLQMPVAEAMIGEEKCGG